MPWGGQRKLHRDDGLNRGGEGVTPDRARAGALQGAPTVIQRPRARQGDAGGRAEGPSCVAL